MNKRVRPSGSTLVLEMKRLYDGGGVICTVSLAGREGTLTKVWKGAVQDLVSVPDAEDIRAWVALTVWNWLLTEGLGQSLPL